MNARQEKASKNHENKNKDEDVSQKVIVLFAIELISMSSLLLSQVFDTVTSDLFQGNFSDVCRFGSVIKEYQTKPLI